MSCTLNFALVINPLVAHCDKYSLYTRQFITFHTPPWSFSRISLSTLWCHVMRNIGVDGMESIIHPQPEWMFLVGGMGDSPKMSPWLWMKGVFDINTSLLPMWYRSVCLLKFWLKFLTNYEKLNYTVCSITASPRGPAPILYIPEEFLLQEWDVGWGFSWEYFGMFVQILSLYFTIHTWKIYLHASTWLVFPPTSLPPSPLCEKSSWINSARYTTLHTTRHVNPIFPLSTSLLLQIQPNGWKTLFPVASALTHFLHKTTIFLNFQEQLENFHQLSLFPWYFTPNI